MQSLDWPGTSGNAVVAWMNTDVQSHIAPPASLPATTAPAGSLTVMPGCQGSCGGVDIPYPFGIGTGCFRKGFQIICINNGSAGSVPVLATVDQNFRVLDLSVAPRPEARVMLPIAWQCFNSSGYVTGTSYGNVNVNPEGVYRISNIYNELYVLGCNTLAYTDSGVRGRYTYSYYTGCVAYSNDSSGPRDGACAGVGCCHVDIPPGLTDNSMTMKSGGSFSHVDQEFCPCDYAFIVEKGLYSFRASDLTSMPKNQTMPVVLDWAIRDNSSTSMTCAQAASIQQDYACKSRHSQCFDAAVGPGYICNCVKGYEGNPYVVDGCTDIDECARPEEFPCHGICKDTEGSYDCKCRPGYESLGDPKEQPCNPKLPHSAKLAIGITVGTSVLILFIIAIGIRFILKKIELKAKEEALKAIEKKNGGDILKNVKTLEFFTKEELDKITSNKQEPLGRGGFGKVYRGVLSDETLVAVKEYIEITAQTQGAFVNEVEIQSMMMHRNILKLLGCCLQVKDPLLVYEYAAKGSLQDILHGDESQQLHPFSLDLRLDIAIGSAQGLAYMHSYAEKAIQHADVKPSNILLNAELVPKISDFGLSKMLTAGKDDVATHVTGYLPYMDPVYKDTRKLTTKSDVYSFGIVLLELICRKRAVSGDSRLIYHFKKIYEQDKSGRAMFDKDIAIEEDIPILDEIGELALKCLKEDVEERPTMVSVASALVLLKETWEKQKVSRGREANASNGAP